MRRRYHMSIDQKGYWDKKIIGWENSIYQKYGHPGNLLENAASLFRGLLKKRMSVAETLLSRHIKNMVVADLGCGSGIFLLNIVRYKPKKLIGIDIAPSAVQVAQEKTKNHPDHQKLEFVCADVRVASDVLDKADIITGIGFIDYLNAKELEKLFRKIRKKKFLFSFPERKITLREIAQRIYLILARCPGAYKYSKAEMNAMLKRAGYTDWWYYDKDTIRFVTNI